MRVPCQTHLENTGVYLVKDLATNHVRVLCTTCMHGISFRTEDGCASLNEGYELWGMVRG